MKTCKGAILEEKRAWCHVFDCLTSSNLVSVGLDEAVRRLTAFCVKYPFHVEAHQCAKVIRLFSDGVVRLVKEGRYTDQVVRYFCYMLNNDGASLFVNVDAITYPPLVVELTRRMWDQGKVGYGQLLTAANTGWRDAMYEGWRHLNRESKETRIKWLREAAELGLHDAEREYAQACYSTDPNANIFMARALYSGLIRPESNVHEWMLQSRGVLARMHAAVIMTIYGIDMFCAGIQCHKCKRVGKCNHTPPKKGKLLELVAEGMSHVKNVIKTTSLVLKRLGVVRDVRRIICVLVYEDIWKEKHFKNALL